MIKRIISVFTILLLAVAGVWADDDYDPQNPPDPQFRFKLTVSASPAEAGYVSGSGLYKAGDQVWLTASNRNNYEFQYWMCDGERVSDVASFYYIMPAKKVNMEAVFAYNPSNPADPTAVNKYRLYLETNMEGSCTFNVTSGAKQIAGRSIRVKTVNISQGYKFLGWYKGDEKLSDDQSYYYLMPNQDVTLTAHFSYDPDSPDDPTSNQTNVDNQEYTMGDANGDGEVNVTDIVEIVNAIMDRPSAKFVRAAADMNHDGEINVTDIVKVVNVIMSANASRATRGLAQASAANGDQLQLMSNDNQTYSLRLNNQGGYVASQFDLYLSKGMTLKKMELNDERCSNHTLSYTDIGNNCYRVVVLSMNNSVFEGHDGELLNFEVTGSGDVDLENILFVNENQTETWFETLHGNMTTGIQETTVTEKKEIYSIDGRLVGQQTEGLTGLAKGIYIINSKKIIVK